MWEVIQTPEFQKWYEKVDEDAREDIYREIRVLSEIGPTLGRPRVDTLKNAPIPNLKELRVQSNGRPFRIFFLFDRNRKAVLLAGENKAGKKRFYDKMIPKAIAIFQKHMENE